MFFTQLEWPCKVCTGSSIRRTSQIRTEESSEQVTNVRWSRNLYGIHKKQCHIEDIQKHISNYFKIHNIVFKRINLLVYTQDQVHSYDDE